MRTVRARSAESVLASAGPPVLQPLQWRAGGRASSRHLGRVILRAAHPARRPIGFSRRGPAARVEEPVHCAPLDLSPAERLVLGKTPGPGNFRGLAELATGRLQSADVEAETAAGPYKTATVASGF